MPACLQIDTRKWALTTELMHLVRDQVFGSSWDLQAVLLLIYASVGITCDLGALKDKDSPLQYLVNKSNYLEHHTRRVCGTQVCLAEASRVAAGVVDHRSPGHVPVIQV